jgi:hypothetical protein
MTDPQPSAINFASFVLSLAHTAAVHFGDVPDPVTGTTGDTNLPAAQQMIEILALLEGQLLEQLLFELRMRYVEAGKGAPAESSEPRIIIP